MFFGPLDWDRCLLGLLKVLYVRIWNMRRNVEKIEGGRLAFSLWWYSLFWYMQLPQWIYYICVYDDATGCHTFVFAVGCGPKALLFCRTAAMPYFAARTFIYLYLMAQIQYIFKFEFSYIWRTNRHRHFRCYAWCMEIDDLNLSIHISHSKIAICACSSQCRHLHQWVNLFLSYKPCTQSI